MYNNGKQENSPNAMLFSGTREFGINCCYK